MNIFGDFLKTVTTSGNLGLSASQIIETSKLPRCYTHSEGRVFCVSYTHIYYQNSAAVDVISRLISSARGFSKDEGATDFSVHPQTLHEATENDSNRSMDGDSDLRLFFFRDMNSRDVGASLGTHR